MQSMSDPMAKASRSRAKDIRQGVTEQRPTLPKRHKVCKPWRVVVIYTPSAVCYRNVRPWCSGRYETQEAANKAAESMRRRHCVPTTLRYGVVVPPLYQSVTVHGPTNS
jgi:hypothetical protein